MLNPTETLSQKFVRKWFWIYLFTFLIWPLGYLIKIIISHDLSVDGVGMIYGVISFVTLLGALNDLGCTESLNYFLPKYIIKWEYAKAKYLLKITLIMQTLSSIAIAVILFVLAPWLAHVYFHEPMLIDILRISGLYFVGINIFHIATVIFSVSQDTKLQKWIEFLKIFSTALATFLVFYLGFDQVEPYMWAWVSGIMIGSVIAVYFAYTRYYRIYFSGIRSERNIAERNHFFRYALATLLTANIGVILSQVDMQLIIVLLGTEATGHYSNYLSLLNIPFIFISPLIAFLFPVISELHGRSDSAKMQTIHREFSLYFSIIGVWLSVFLYQFGVPLALLFFGKDFLRSGEILGYSAFFVTFILLIQINFQFLAGTGQIGTRARILAIILPINIILNYICIRLYGVAGSALAVGLSWIPLWYLSHRAIHLHRSQFDWGILIKNIIMAGLSFLLLHQYVDWIRTIDLSKLWLLSLLALAILINLTIFVIGNWKLLTGVWETIRKNR
jgi:stage V sporulation protein B